MKTLALALAVRLFAEPVLNHFFLPSIGSMAVQMSDLTPLIIRCSSVMVDSPLVGCRNRVGTLLANRLG